MDCEYDVIPDGGRKYAPIVSFFLSVLFLSGFLSCTTVPEGVPEPVPQEEVPGEEVYESIGVYIVTGDIAGALEAFETLRREKPDDPDTKNAYIKLLLAAGSFDEAAAMIESILAVYPENPGALFNRALLCGFTGDEETRELDLLKVVELDPEYADAWALLGELYLERKNYEKAESSFTAGLSADPDDPMSRAGLARLLRRRGDLTGALFHLDRLIENDETFSFAWADRGAIKAASGDTSGAEDDYSKALELDPEFSWHYIDRAKLFLSSRRLEEALTDLDRAILLDPGQFYPYILRAGARDELDLRAGAIDDYYAALEKRPDYYFAYENAAILLFMEERWKEAEGMFLKAYPYARERWDFLLLSGICRLKRGAEAKDFFNDQVHRIPREDLLYHVGRVFLEPGYVDMAIHLIQQAGSSPEGTRALFYLAQYFLLAGSQNTALTYFLEIEERNIPGLIETRLAKAEREKISDIF